MLRMIRRSSNSEAPTIMAFSRDTKKIGGVKLSLKNRTRVNSVSTGVRSSILTIIAKEKPRARAKAKEKRRLRKKIVVKRQNERKKLPLTQAHPKIPIIYWLVMGGFDDFIAFLAKRSFAFDYQFTFDSILLSCSSLHLSLIHI